MSNLIKLFSTLFILLITLIVPVVFAQQDLKPGIKMTGMSVSSNKISGKLDIQNDNTQGYADAYYHIELYSEGSVKPLEVDGKQYTVSGGKNIITSIDSNKLNIKASEFRQFSFDFEYPETVKSGKYTLLAELRDSENNMLFFSNLPIDLTGSGQFVFLDNSSCYFKIQGITYSITSGPSVEANTSPTAFCKITNPSKEELNLQYKISYSQKNQNVYSKDSQVDSPKGQITLKGNETKEVEIQFPALDTPQVYDGLVTLTSEGGVQISPRVHFRWIVQGKSAIINSLNTDKGYYKEGEIAHIIFSGGPSLDLTWRTEESGDEPGFSPSAGTQLNNPEFVVEIKNSINQICGTTKQKLHYDQMTTKWTDTKIDVNIIHECKDPIINASIVDGDQTLYSMSKKIIATDEELGLKGGNWLTKDNFRGLSLIIVLTISAILGYVFFKRRKHPPSEPPPSNIATPVSAGTLVVIFLMILIGVVQTVRASEMFLNIAIDPYGPNNIKKQPINSSDVNVKNVYHWRQGHGGLLYWMNFQDFSQTSSGAGKSSVQVSPDCQTIDVLVDSTSGFDLSCGNWGSGVTVLSYLDKKPISVSNVSSPNGMKIFNSPYGPHSYTLYDFFESSRKISQFKLTNPNPGGEHTLELFLGSTSVNDTHEGLKTFDTSFNRFPTGNLKETQCDSRDHACFGVLTYNFSCTPTPPACNISCSSNEYCQTAKDGCIACVDGKCQKPPSSPSPSPSATPPPACNTQCSDDRQCLEAKDGCTMCVGGVCKVPPACNSACSNPSDCARATNGCTSCLPGDTGTGNVCRPTPACNTACTNDRQCVGAKDGCISCINGACKVPPSCGTACTTKAQCAGVKDGCSECLEGTCTDYNSNMCKCDGMVTDMVYPSDSFNFEAFGKVQGSDVKKAQIADVTFRMTKDNQVIAKSSPITPTVVESSANKLRVKASWSTPPPPVSKGSTYRVFADVRCKPKRIVASAGTNSTSLKPPPGLKLLVEIANKLGGDGNEPIKSITSRLLSMFTAPIAQAQTSNLQLQTLNFVKVLDTDNCRFVMFKFDETLF